MSSNNGDNTKPSFDLDNFLQKNKIVITVGLVGVIFVGLGVFLVKDRKFSQNDVEIVDTSVEEIVVVIEVAGAVKSPGVYEMQNGARVEDALVIAGGLSDDADALWIEKTVNRASKLVDGQKVFIKTTNEHSESGSANILGGNQGSTEQTDVSGESLVNVNSASMGQLEALWGIGPVTAQNIIEQRPYSNIEDLLSKGILKENVYERNKEILIIY